MRNGDIHSCDKFTKSDQIVSRFSRLYCYPTLMDEIRPQSIRSVLQTQIINMKTGPSSKVPRSYLEGGRLFLDLPQSQGYSPRIISRLWVGATVTFSWEYHEESRSCEVVTCYMSLFKWKYNRWQDTRFLADVVGGGKAALVFCICTWARISYGTVFFEVVF